MLVFRKEILAMISNELNKRLVNYEHAVTRVEELEKSNRHLRVQLHSVEQNLQRICKDVGSLQERAAKTVVNAPPMDIDQRIDNLREQIENGAHALRVKRSQLAQLEAYRTALSEL